MMMACIWCQIHLELQSNVSVQTLRSLSRIAAGRASASQPAAASCTTKIDHLGQSMHYWQCCFSITPLNTAIAGK
jgi:hypothetical protein